jgi:hypothetical protein
MDKIPEKVHEESVITEDEFETVINYVMNGHKSSMPYYCTGMDFALDFLKKCFVHSTHPYLYQH